MLRVVNLSCSKGERILFSGVQTELKPGEILHVRGENGVGKTSPILKTSCSWATTQP
jgi:heme exporter protein A